MINRLSGKFLPALGINKTSRKPQTTILRSRVALAIIEDSEMLARMFKDGTYKKHFYNIKKGASSRFLDANIERIKKNENPYKALQFELNNCAVWLKGLKLLLEDNATKKAQRSELEVWSCITSAQHKNNYKHSQDKYNADYRMHLKALVIDMLPAFRLK